MKINSLKFAGLKTVAATMTLSSLYLCSTGIANAVVVTGGPTILNGQGTDGAAVCQVEANVMGMGEDDGRNGLDRAAWIITDGTGAVVSDNPVSGPGRAFAFFQEDGSTTTTRTTAQGSTALTISALPTAGTTLNVRLVEQDVHSGKVQGDVLGSVALTPANLRAIPGGGGFCGQIADRLEAAGMNGAPTAVAGNDQNITAPSGTTVTLNGSASSDPDMDGLTYTWTQTGGATVALTGADTAMPSFSTPAASDTLIFSLVVNDGTVNSVADTVTINYTAQVVAMNNAPVADAGADQNVNTAAGSTITLDGTGSSDSDMDMLTYTWIQTGGATVTLTGANTASPTFPAPAADDTLVFSLVVNDGSVDSVADTVTINYTAPSVTMNNAPVADAGADQNVTAAAGSTVTLDGSASSDADMDMLTYTWTQTGGATVTLTGADTASPTFPTPAADDTLVFSLIVNDGTVDSVADTVTINFALPAPVNAVPVADAGTDQTMTAAPGATVSLDGTGSSDADMDMLTYAWTQTSGTSVTLTGADTATPSFPTPADDSTLVFSLVVNDGTEDSVADTVTVNYTANNIPTAAATTPEATVSPGATVTLDGSTSSDPEDGALTYAWTQSAGPAVTLAGAATAMASFTAPAVTEATDFIFDLVVNDGTSSSASSQVTVTVQPTGSITLVVNSAGGDRAFTIGSNLAALTGTITTVNGTGSLQAADVAAGDHTITLPDLLSEGFAYTGLTCGDANAVIGADNLSAAITLDAGEDVTCILDAVNSRGIASGQIRDMLVQRGTMILANQPNLTRRMQRLSGAMSSDGGVSAGGFMLPGTGKLPVSVSLNSGQSTFSTSLSQMTGGNSGLGEGSVDVWAEAVLANFENADNEGNFSLFYAGVDYVVNPNLLVGVLAQYDSYDAGGAVSSGNIDGTGYMVGPYATYRLTDKIVVDGRLAWGTSDNSISPLGTTLDSFDTTRQLAVASVSGQHNFSNGVKLTPTLSARYLKEEQDAYTDSLNVMVTSQDVTLGEISFAPRLSKHYTMSADWDMDAFITAEGIYSIGDDVEDVLGSAIRARLEGGATFGFAESDFSWGLSGFSDGLGSDDFSSYGVRLSIGKGF